MPPLTTTERSRKSRAERPPLPEVRGIRAPINQHAAIKAAVREMIEGKKK
jgi:hypothetical protein